MINMFFDKKNGSRASVNEKIAEELLKPVIKNSKNYTKSKTYYRKSILSLKIVLTTDLAKM